MTYRKSFRRCVGSYHASASAPFPIAGREFERRLSSAAVRGIEPSLHTQMVGFAHVRRRPAIGDERVSMPAIGPGAERSQQWIWAPREMGPSR
jgi:hypothetical protein